VRERTPAEIGEGAAVVVAADVEVGDADQDGGLVGGEAGGFEKFRFRVF
jgi:hypothetical protein